MYYVDNMNNDKCIYIYYTRMNPMPQSAESKGEESGKSRIVIIEHEREPCKDVPLEPRSNTLVPLVSDLFRVVVELNGSYVRNHYAVILPSLLIPTQSTIYHRQLDCLQRSVIPALSINIPECQYYH